MTDYHDFEVMYLGTTPNSVKVSYPPGSAESEFVPFSHMEEKPKHAVYGDTVTIRITEWIAKQKGWW